MTLRPSRPSSRARTLAVLLALAAVTTAHAPAIITVRPGDTLWDLARAHDTSVSTLQQLNDLPGNGAIYAGQTLRISGSGGAAGSRSSSGSGTHVVARGDTLSEIAQRYGVSASAVRSANAMSSSTVQLGRKLVIPARGNAARSNPTHSNPTHNAGVPIRPDVRTSASRNRAALSGRQVPSKAEARRLVAATARRYGVDPSLALAVAYHESGFQQRVVSPVDAIGVMQVLPSTGRGMSRVAGRELDLLDARDNITAGVLLLRQLVRSTGSTDRALAGYYQGLGSISRRGVLPQTRTYIRNISALRSRFA